MMTFLYILSLLACLAIGYYGYAFILWARAFRVKAERFCDNVDELLALLNKPLPVFLVEEPSTPSQPQIFTSEDQTFGGEVSK